MAPTAPVIDSRTQDKFDSFQREVDRMDLILEFFEYRKKAPLYEQRRKLIKTIPRFWYMALMNNDDISIELQHKEDQEALEFLEDIWVVRSPIDPRVYTIEFMFKSNPFFEDKVLRKVYKYSESRECKAQSGDSDGFKWGMLDFDWEEQVQPQSTTIKWKRGKNLSSKYPRKGADDNLPDELGSFFNWFTHPSDAFDIGVTIAEDIFPDAIDYYTGQVGCDDSDEESDEDDDDDDDDDDEEEEEEDSDSD
ncbi:Nucleosome assembly protein (NAP) [Ceratobasidium sp. AG-Ba]|nr:Nucleosome assembly protein (NAP) [Ceratobasidium sp. AG-Ba]